MGGSRLIHRIDILEETTVENIAPKIQNGKDSEKSGDGIIHTEENQTILISVTVVLLPHLCATLPVPEVGRQEPQSWL